MTLHRLSIRLVGPCMGTQWCLVQFQTSKSSRSRGASRLRQYSLQPSVRLQASRETCPVVRHCRPIRTEGFDVRTEVPWFMMTKITEVPWWFGHLAPWFTNLYWYHDDLLFFFCDDSTIQSCISWGLVLTGADHFLDSHCSHSTHWVWPTLALLSRTHDCYLKYIEIDWHVLEFPTSMQYLSQHDILGIRAS
jgi:hypothetical protein